MKKSYVLFALLLTLSLVCSPLTAVETVVAAKEVTTGNLNGIEVYNLCMPGVVHITHQSGGGSGFFIESKKVVTNFHVIKEAEKLDMVDMNDKHYTVKSILGYNEDLDLAIIETKESGTPIKINTSHKLQPGEMVYTLGCPFGIPFVIAQGLLGKPDWEVDGRRTVMHTAPMSSGNSGGPLVNSYGEVIGINTFSMGSDAQCLNFAVKIEELSKVNTSKPMTMEQFVDRDNTPIKTVDISKAKVGDYIVMGKYEQDNDKSHREDIEWLVLAEKDGKLLVVSRFCLDVTCWNSKNEFVSWEKSEHRSWLNGKFYKDSFTDAEKKRIVSVNTSDKITNPKSNTKTGTFDNVFLMSLDEISLYFVGDLDRRACATKYCKALGAGEFGNRYTFWSTRTPSGSEEGKYCTIAVFGDVTSDNPDGTSIVGKMTTRPAMWITK